MAIKHNHVVKMDKTFIGSGFLPPIAFLIAKDNRYPACVESSEERHDWRAYLINTIKKLGDGYR